MKTDITFRSAELSDLPRLAALMEACAEAPQWMQSTWGQVLASSAASGQRTALVAQVNGETVGFGVVRVVESEAEIESVAVEPRVRRRGIGKGLCEAMLREARVRGAEQVFLEVRISNHGAQALYQLLGFEECGRRVRYYRQPDEDAMVMRRKLRE